MDAALAWSGTNTLAARAAALAAHFTILKPDGAGPFPTVLMLHGCGGRRSFLDRWARVLQEAGVGAVIVDSFAPRRIGRAAALATVCTLMRLPGRERAGDLYAAMHWARMQDWIDQSRIIAAGWSHGGWTVIDALALNAGAEMQTATGLVDLPEEPLAGLAGAFLLYPYVGVMSLAKRWPWRLAPPATAILGGRDYIVGVKTPRAVLERARAHGAPIDIHFFADATHAFDEASGMDPRMNYHDDATRRAEKLLLELVAKTK